MIDLKTCQVWFVTGSQHLYGPAALRQVAANSLQIAQALDAARAIPVDADDVVYVSVYCDRSDFQIEYRWVGPDGYITGTQETATPAMRVRGGETNGNGWYRFWAAARAPAAWELGGGEAPAYVIPYLTLTAGQTYRFSRSSPGAPPR